jgi:hypothetical protein
VKDSTVTCSRLAAFWGSITERLVNRICRLRKFFAVDG